MPPYGALGAGIGAGAGAGLGGLLGQMGGVLDMPRRGVWSMLGLPDRGADVLSQHLGMDPESALTQGLGTGLEMLGDPLTWGGGALLGRAGKMLGGAVESLGGRAASRAALQGELPMMERLAAMGGKPGASPLEEALTRATYHPDVLAELPDVVKGGPRTYNRTDPAVAQLVNDMGIGNPTAGGGMSVLQKPSFAGGRGGVMKPQDIAPGGLPGGYMSTLDVPGHQMGAFDPMELMTQLQKGGPVDAQRLSQIMSPQEVAGLRQQFPTMGASDLERKLQPGILSQDPRTMQAGPFTHISDMPVGQAAGLAGSRATDIRQQLAQLADPNTMSILERLLAKRFGGT